MSRDEEKRIIKSIQAGSGNQDAEWAQLTEEYYGNVYQCARSAARTNADAKDVAQEAWISFWKYIPRFDPDQSSILGFLRRLVRNAAADLYPPGTPAVYAIDDPGDGMPLTNTLRGKGPSPIEWTERRELYTLLLKTMTHLDSPPHLKIAFGFLRLLEWESGPIVTRWSPETLAEAGKTLKTDFGRAGRVSDKDNKAAFQRLCVDLKAPVRWEHVAAAQAGSTLLEIYYTVTTFEERKQRIQAWADTVRRKLVKRLAITLPDERIEEGDEQ